MITLRLGARLALAGGRTRAALVVAGNAIGVALLLLTFAVPAGLSRDLTLDEQRLAAVVAVAVATPIAVLLMTVTRLSAATRDRRLAALRLLGVTPARTRAIAAVEAILLACAGVVVGVAVFLLAVRPAAEALDAAWRAWFPGPLVPSMTGFALACLGVPGLSVLVSLAPIRALRRGALSTRRQGSVRRPSLWRLAPLGAGIAALTWVVLQPGSEERLGAFLAGASLAGIGVPIAAPVTVRLVADFAVRRGRSPALLLAGRRLQLEPASTTRVVAGLLVALFVVAGARCVLTAWETTPQYLAAQRANTTGPQTLHVSPVVTRHGDPAGLAGLPGVRAVVPMRFVGSRCDGADSCGNVFVGTCRDLLALEPTVQGCRDDRVGQLGYGQGWQQPRAVTLLNDTGGSGRLVLASPPERWGVAVKPEDITGVQVDLFVPLTTPGIAAVLSPVSGWQVIADGGPRPRDMVSAAAARLGLRAEPDWNLSELRLVAGYRAILWAVAGLVLSVGFAALLLTGVDRALERRREVGALAALGVPRRVIRRSQLLQVLAPLVAGVPAASAAGLLAGAAYLSYGGERHATPWPEVAALTGIALAVAVAVALATTLGVRSAPPHQALRRE